MFEAVAQPAGTRGPLFRPHYPPQSFVTAPAGKHCAFLRRAWLQHYHQELLRQRTTEYDHWVQACACDHNIPIEWAIKKKVRKQTNVRPHLRQMKRRERSGVYFILKSMEVETNFRVTMPK
jgi:hypothetical protein